MGLFSRQQRQQIKYVRKNGYEAYAGSVQIFDDTCVKENSTYMSAVSLLSKEISLYNDVSNDIDGDLLSKISYKYLTDGVVYLGLTKEGLLQIIDCDSVSEVDDPSMWLVSSLIVTNSIFMDNYYLISGGTFDSFESSKGNKIYVMYYFSGDKKLTPQDVLYNELNVHDKTSDTLIDVASKGNQTSPIVSIYDPHQTESLADGIEGLYDNFQEYEKEVKADGKANNKADVILSALQQRKPFVVEDRKVDVHTMTVKQEDVADVPIMDWYAKNIVSFFGVPLQYFFVDSMKYNSEKEKRIALYEHGVLPIINKIEAFLSLVYDTEIELVNDVFSVSQEKVLSKIERLVSLGLLDSEELKEMLKEGGIL